MGFDTIIVNGRVATATDTYTSDVAINDGKISAVGQSLPRENAGTDHRCGGKYVFPGGIDVHTHLDMPFGGTTSADDFETGTRAAAFGGTTTLIDFAIQYKGQTLRTAFDAWMQKASGKAVCDYAFHCIITDLADAQLDEMNALVREGVTSFKLFMAYPGVFMLDDASIFKALRATSKNGGLVCMHAENGGAIDVIVQQALAEGKKAPKYHALDPSHNGGSGSGFARDCAGRNGGSAGLHRPLELQRRARKSARGARSRTSRLCRDLSAVSVSLAGKHGCARIRRREVCFHSAAAREVASGKTLERIEDAIICRWFRPITVRSASRSRKNWAETISPRSRTAVRASSTA